MEIPPKVLNAPVFKHNERKSNQRMAEDEDGQGGSRAQWSLEAEEEEEPAGPGDRKGGGRSRKDTRKEKKQYFLMLRSSARSGAFN